MLQPEVENWHATLDIVDPAVVRRWATVHEHIGAARTQKRNVGELHRAILHILLGPTVGALDDCNRSRPPDWSCPATTSKAAGATD
eukprot:5921907-Prymnesium_polylepis.1